MHHIKKKKIKEKKIYSQLEKVDFVCASKIYCCGKGNVNRKLLIVFENFFFSFYLYIFWCLRKLQGRNITLFPPPDKPIKEMEVMRRCAAYSMIRGRQYSAPVCTA